MFNSVLILFSAYRGDVPNRDKEVAAGIQRFFYFKRRDIISAMPKLLALILLFPLLFSCQSVGTGMESIEIEPTLNEVQPSTIERAEEEFAESIKVVEETPADMGEEEVISTRELVERINNISSGNKAPSLTEEEVVIETEPRDLAGEVPVEGVVLNEIPRELPETAPGNASEMRWMDQRLDDLSYMLLFEFALIVILFTVVSIIRGHSYGALSIVSSIVLSLLFTSLPIAIASYFLGWNNYFLFFLILLLSFFVFRSHRKH